MAIALVVGAGCGDPQLNQSRREPLFVGQELISTAYAPGLIVVAGFPDLNPLKLENPRFVSSNSSVATASVIQGDLVSGLDLRELVMRLNTGAPGTAEITLFDGDELIRTVPIQVSRPKGWRFDFSYQNAFAPSDAALTSDEPIALLERGELFATVEFSRTMGFLPDDLLIGSGRIDSTSDLLLEVQPTSLEMVGAGTDVLRFNQLTSGDLVSIVTAALVPIVGLELPNGESIFSSRLESTSGFDVEELELIVSRKSENDRADVAVYGRSESGRVLGLAPVVTLDGVPLRPFVDGFLGPTYTWLFNLPRFGPRTGTLEARWRDLDPQTVELGSAEVASCVAPQNALVYEALDYTGRDGGPRSGSDAASAIGFDCLFGVDVGILRNCGSETGAVLSDLPSPSREVIQALTSCVEECVVEVTAALAGQSLTPNCALCYASFASCSTEFCALQCAESLGAENCVRCNDDAGCTRSLSTCSSGTAGSGGAGGTGGAGGMALACKPSVGSCETASVNPMIEDCVPAFPTPPTVSVCNGDEPLVNPDTCATTGSVVRHELTQMEVLNDCNAGYDLDMCDGRSCDKGGIAPAEGLAGVDNALAGLGPTFTQLGLNLGDVNQVFYDALCAGLADISFVIDINAAESCATLELVVNGSVASTVRLNAGAESGGGLCLSGTVGSIPLGIGFASLENAVVRMTLSEEGFSNGVLGCTVDEATAALVMDLAAVDGSALVGQMLDINADLSVDSVADCNAISATLEIGGVAAP